MSREIDERIVSMQFENRHFEKNANQSMSTLDKLKEKLNFKAAAKGVDNLDAAVKKVDFSSMGKSVDNVGLRFNAMYTVADQTFRNIVNSAEATAKRMISAFTIDPIKTGLSEYETKINAIQVIKANTRGKFASEAEQMEAITSALSELNAYADNTIYNFAQMTDNVGKFVSQTGDVEKSVKAVQGLANLAGASGASASDMARATYQMSQALGGTIRKMDWNSLRNANMAGQELKNMLSDLARVEGIDIDSLIAKKGTFEDTLEEGWLTGDLFMKAMNIYSDAYSEAELAAMGFNDTQIANFKDLANTAKEATTEVKTFTQLFDVLKETAQSGWTQTWEEVVGDFDTAKKTLSQVQVYFSNIINAMSDARNFVVKHALNFAEPWLKIMEKLNDSGIGKAAEALTNYTDKLQYFQEIMHSVWMGNYRNADTGRYGLLDTAGYDHRVVQELVNISDKHYHEQGWKYQLTVDDIRAAHEKYGLTLDENTVSLNEAGTATLDLTSALDSLSDSQLKEAGLTEDEIKVLRELQEESKRTGRSIKEIGDEMSNTTGRMLIIDSLKNVWSGMLGIFTAVGNAWKEIFPPIGFVQLYNAIKAVNKFSENLRLTDKNTGELTETAKKLQRIFKGIFAIVDVVTTLIGGGFKIAFKIAGALLKLFGTDILTVAAHIGDLMVKFRDFMDSILDFETIFKGIISFGKKAFGKLKDWFEGLKDATDKGEYIKNSLTNGVKSAYKWITESIIKLGKYIVKKFESIFGVDLSAVVKKHMPKVTKAFEAVKKWFKESDFIEAAKYCILGFIKGVKDNAPKVLKSIWELGKNILSKICEVLGIHSPSREFFEIGKNCILGLINGIKSIVTIAFDLIKNVGLKLVEIVKGLDLGTVLAGALSIGSLIVLYKGFNMIGGLFSMFEGLGDFFESLGKAVSRLSKAAALKTVSKAVINFALAIAILVASLYVLAKIAATDSGALWEAVGALFVLTLIVVGLAAAITLMNKTPDGKIDDDSKMINNILALVAIAASVLILASALKKLSTISPDEMKVAMTAMAGIIIGMLAIMYALSKLSNSKTAVDIAGAGSMLLKMAIAMGVMVFVVKMASKLDNATVNQGLKTLAKIELLFLAVIAVSKLSGEHASKAGSMLLKMAVAMIIMVAAVSLAAKLKPSTVDKGIKTLAKIELLFLAVIAVSKLCGQHASKAGSMLLKMAIAIIIMVAAVKLVSKLSDAEVERGIKVVGTIELLFAILIGVSKFAGENASQAGSMLLKLSVALLILVAVIFLISLMKEDAVKRGVTVVGILELLFAVLLGALSKVKCDNNTFKTVTMLMVIIVILVAAVAGLSFIKPEKLQSSANALSEVLLALAAAMWILSKAKGIENSTIGKALLMGLVIAEIGGVLAGMSSLGTENAIANATGLSEVLIALAYSMTILNGCTVTAKTVGIAALMGLVMGELGGVLAGMSALNTENTVANATGISEALVALAYSMTILNGCAVTAKTVGIASLMAAVMGELGAVLWGMSELDVENAIPNAVALSALILALAWACNLLIPVGTAGTAAIKGAGVFAAVVLIIEGTIAAFGAILMGLGYLVSKISPETMEKIKMGLKNFMEIIGIFAEGIGEAIGKFVGGVLGGTLEALGNSLSDFMENIQGFIAGCEKIDAKFGKGVGFLVAGILGLTVADFIEGVSSVLQFGNDLPELGKELSQFMINALPFVLCASTIKPNMMEGVKRLAEAVLLITAADFMNAINIFGSASPVSYFAGQLKDLATGVNDFVASVGALTDDDVDIAERAANIIYKLAKAAGSIPNSGGLLGSILGNNDLGTFADQFANLGNGISSLITSLRFDANGNAIDFGEEEVQLVENAAAIITCLANAAASIPNSGGWLADLVGDNDIGTFATKLPILAGGIATFTSMLKGYDLGEKDISTAKTACTIISELAKVAQAIPNTGGLLADLIGDNDIGTFSMKLPLVAAGIVGFMSVITAFNGWDILTATVAIAVLRSLADLASAVPDMGSDFANWFKGGDDLTKFAEMLPTLGEALNDFVSNIDTIDANSVVSVQLAINALSAIASLDFKNMNSYFSAFGDNIKKFADNLNSFVTTLGGMKKVQISQSIQIVERLANMIRGFEDLSLGTTIAFGDMLKGLATDGITKFTNVFSDPTLILQMQSAVLTMVSTSIVAVTNSKDTLVSAFTDIVKAAPTGMASPEILALFSSAGGDLVDGLVTGIDAKWQDAYDAGYAIGQAAVAGEKAGQKSNSPSKITFQAGKWIGEGLINGMVKMTSAVYGAGYDLGELATDSISSAVNRISAALESDIDSQPTITPVLDLSNVTSGANAINGLFSGNRTLTVDTAAVGAVAASMSNRQNGMDTSDVVSAVKALSKQVANMPRESISINGITYDDGSNIADAVQTLVRAAKIERRV